MGYFLVSEWLPGRDGPSAEDLTDGQFQRKLISLAVNFLFA